MNKRMSIREFRELGLLQEVNRQFLHPLGLALEIVIDGEEMKLGGIWDCRDDPEGICFDPALIDIDKIKRVMKFQAERHQRRQELLGYVVQGYEGVGG